MIYFFYSKFIEESKYRIHFDQKLIQYFFFFLFTFSVHHRSRFCFHDKMHQINIKIVQNKTKPVNESTAAVLLGSLLLY